jgi:TetR/AcrR family transcriptional regulator, cholesterol catabolism regulator
MGVEAGEGTLDLDGEPLTMTSDIAAVRTPPASQLARRERILDAAVELATDGGYDAVQMREVADRADVALGTLYRYFPSKVHLLVSAMGRTFNELQVGVETSGASSTPEERVYRVVAAVTRYLAKNRRLSGAMIRALMMADQDAGREVDAVGDLMVGFIAAASHEPGTTPSERDTLVAHVIGKVWLTDVLTLLTRRMTVSQVLEDLEATIALVMSR